MQSSHRYTQIDVSMALDTGFPAGMTFYLGVCITKSAERMNNKRAN